MKNADFPAMPISRDLILPAQGETLPGGYPYGLTKREHIAAMALQGFLSGPNADADCGIEGLAHDSVMAADFLLAELEKGRDHTAEQRSPKIVRVSGALTDYVLGMAEWHSENGEDEAIRKLARAILSLQKEA